jgi:hypothetical protein
MTTMECHLAAMYMASDQRVSTGHDAVAARGHKSVSLRHGRISHPHGGVPITDALVHHCVLVTVLSSGLSLQRFRKMF